MERNKKLETLGYSIQHTNYSSSIRYETMCYEKYFNEKGVCLVKQIYQDYHGCWVGDLSIRYCKITSLEKIQIINQAWEELQEDIKRANENKND